MRIPITLKISYALSASQHQGSLTIASGNTTEAQDADFCICIFSQFLADSYALITTFYQELIMTTGSDGS
jgi:hypothetical protein